MVAAAAYYELPAQLRVTASCLGKRFATAIGDRPVTLATPQLRWTKDRPSVIAPVSKAIDSKLLSHMAESGKEGWEKWDAWGSIGQWNVTKGVATDVAISSVLFEFKLDAQAISYSDYMHGRGHPEGAELDALFSNVGDWFESLRTWIEVAVDQDIDPLSPVSRISVPGDGLQVVTVEGSTSSLPARPSTISIMEDPAERLNLQSFRRVLAKMRMSSRPSDAHLLLRDARADLRRGRLRKAVIDAGSAVELTLADVNRRGPQVNTGRRPTLGWFVDQPAIAAAGGLPANTKSDLVGVRNDAIHHNVVPSRSAAHGAISLAKSILDTADPLGV